MLAALTLGLVLAEQDHGCRVTRDPCPQALCMPRVGMGGSRFLSPSPQPRLPKNIQEP